MRYIDSKKQHNGFSQEGIKDLHPLEGIADSTQITSRYHKLAELFYEEVSYRIPPNDYQVRGLYASREDMESALRLVVAESVIRFNWESYVIDPDITIRRFNAFLQQATKKILKGDKPAEERQAVSLEFPIGNSHRSNLTMQETIQSRENVEGEVLSSERSNDIMRALEQVATKISSTARDIFLSSVLEGISDRELAKRYGFDDLIKVAALRQQVQRELIAALSPSLKEEVAVRSVDNFPGSRIEREDTLWGKMADPKIQQDLLQRLDNFEASITRNERIFQTAVAIAASAHRQGKHLTTKEVVEQVRMSLPMLQLHPENILTIIRTSLGLDYIRERKNNDISHIGIIDKHRSKIRKIIETQDQIVSPIHPKQTRYKIFKAFLESTATKRDEILSDIKANLAGDPAEKAHAVKLYLQEMILQIDRNEDIIIQNHMEKPTLWTLLADEHGIMRQRYEVNRDTIEPKDQEYIETLFRFADGKMTSVLRGMQKTFRRNPEFRELYRIRNYIPKLLVKTGLLNEQEVTSILAREKPIDPYEISSDIKRRLKDQLDQQVALSALPKLSPQERAVFIACLQVAAPHHINDVDIFYKDIIPLVGLDENGNSYTTREINIFLTRGFKKILPEAFARARRENVHLFDLLVESGRKKADDFHDQWTIFARNGHIIRYAIGHATGYRNTTIEIVRNQFPQLFRSTIETAIRDGIFHLFEEDEREQIHTKMTSGIWEAIIQSPQVIEEKLGSGKANGKRQEDRLRPLDKRVLQTALHFAQMAQREGKTISKSILVELVTRQEYGQQYLHASLEEQRARRQTIDKVIRRSVNILYERETYQKGERIKGWRWRTERNAIIRLMQNPNFEQFLPPERRQRMLGLIRKYYLEIPDGESPPKMAIIAQSLGEPISNSGFTQLTHDLEYLRHKILSPFMSHRILEGISAS